MILPKSNWVRDFVGHLVDAHGDAELRESLHEVAVEFGYRPEERAVLREMSRRRLTPGARASRNRIQARSYAARTEWKTWLDRAATRSA